MMGRKRNGELSGARPEADLPRRNRRRAGGTFLALAVILSLSPGALPGPCAAEKLPGKKITSVLGHGMSLPAWDRSYLFSVAASEVDVNSMTSDTIRQREAEVSETEQGKRELEQGQEEARSELNQLEEAKSASLLAIEDLDRQSGAVQDGLLILEQDILENQEKLSAAEEAVRDARAKVEEQYAGMKRRIRFLYETGDETWFDILLSSGSFGAFLNNEVYIRAIEEYDDRKLREFREAKNELARAGEELRLRQEELEQSLSEQREKQETLQALMAKKTAEVETYQKLIGDREQQIRAYQAEIAAQEAQIAALEAAILKEKQALAEAERRRRMYDGGQFTLPCPGYTRISDEYGMRTHPTLGVEMMHNGIDFAAPSGSAILAAYQGEVAAAAYSSTMGNYVMIDHGSGLFTVYMHASSLQVSEGQTVSRGQRIGSVGSTGRSTGPHLHFGVRENGTYVNPWKYLRG